MTGNNLFSLYIFDRTEKYFLLILDFYYTLKFLSFILFFFELIIFIHKILNKIDTNSRNSFINKIFSKERIWIFNKQY